MTVSDSFQEENEQQAFRSWWLLSQRLVYSHLLSRWAAAAIGAKPHQIRHHCVPTSYVTGRIGNRLKAVGGGGGVIVSAAFHVCSEHLSLAFWKSWILVHICFWLLSWLPWMADPLDPPSLLFRSKYRVGVWRLESWLNVNMYALDNNIPALSFFMKLLSSLTHQLFSSNNRKFLASMARLR